MKFGNLKQFLLLFFIIATMMLSPLCTLLRRPNFLSAFLSQRKTNSSARDAQLNAQSVESPSPNKEQMEAVLDEIAMAAWEEEMCATKMGTWKLNPFLLKDNGKLAIQLEWLINSNCIGYETRKTLRLLYITMMPMEIVNKTANNKKNNSKKPVVEKKEKEQQNSANTAVDFAETGIVFDWKAFLHLIKKHLDKCCCTFSWCELSKHGRIQLSQLIRQNAVQAIVQSLDGEKCLGVELFTIDGEQIGVEVENLRKSNCVNNLRIKWLKIDAELFLKLPRDDVHKNPNAKWPIEQELVNKAAAWNAANTTFKQITHFLIEAIVFDEKKLPWKELSGLFLVEANTQRRTTSSASRNASWNFDLDAFIASASFSQKIINQIIEKKIDNGIDVEANVWEKLENNFDVKTWLKEKANKCWQKNAFGKYGFACVPVHKGSHVERKIGEHEENLFQLEYADQYRRMAEQMVDAYFRSAELSVVYGKRQQQPNDGGGGVQDACKTLKPFRIEQPNRGNDVSQRRFLIQVDLLIQILDKQENRPSTKGMMNIVEEMVQMKQFYGAAYTPEWSSKLKSLLTQINAYYNPKSQWIGLLADNVIELVKAQTKRCWKTLMHETINCFLSIAECRRNDSTRNAATVFFKFKAGISGEIASTSMQTLLKQNADCWSNIQKALYERHYESFTDVFSQILNNVPFRRQSSGKNLSDPKNLSNWMQTMGEAEEYLNVDGKEFELTEEQSKIAEQYFGILKKAYEILGLRYDCTFDEFKAAYKKAVLIYHPDKTADDKEKNSIFALINTAYEIRKKGNDVNVNDGGVRTKF